MQKSRLAIGIVAIASALAMSAPSIAAAASADGADAIIATKIVGGEEVPGPGDYNGKGAFSAVLSQESMCYSYYARKIGAPVAAHIHAAEMGVAGPVVITLELPTRRGVSACLVATPDAEDTGATMSVSELAALKATPNLYYVNVHTAAFPSGAIRGQL